MNKAERREEERRRHRVNVEQKLFGRGRKVVSWWDGEPVHRPLKLHERVFPDGKKLTKGEWNLLIGFLTHPRGTEALLRFNKPV